MPTAINEPLHLGVLCLCAIITCWVWTRCRYHHHKLLAGALLGVIIAESLKSEAIAGWIDAQGGALMWRGVVQSICLLSFTLVSESILAAIWGALWTPWRLWTRLSTVTLIGIALCLISWPTPTDVDRIENVGGWRPALFLAIFSMTMILLAIRSLYGIIANWYRHSLLVWIAELIIMIFALDSLSLLISFFLHDGVAGRNDGGVLWISTLAATVVVGLSAFRWNQKVGEQEDEAQVLRLWKLLYERWGQGNASAVLEQRKRGGMLFAWIVILQETADFIAVQSRKIPPSLRNNLQLGEVLLLVDDDAPAQSPPRIVEQWGDLVGISQGYLYSIGQTQS